MEYVGLTLQDTVRIDQLFTVHWFEYTKSYAYAGEKHDFWECVYVDRGEILITADDRETVLSHGEILFHAPNEWHTLRANGRVAPNLVVFSFSSSSPIMERFVHRRARVGQAGRVLIADILRESERIFSTPLGDPSTHRMQRRGDVPLGAEQRLRTAMEGLLLLLAGADATAPVTPLRRTQEQDVYALLLSYMQENLGRHLTLKDLASCGGVSVSTVKDLFRARTGQGAIDTFIHMKIEAAKAYIREGDYNMTQISDLLGYESIHYFSRQFRAVTGRSPSEYSRSVRAIEEGNATE